MSQSSTPIRQISHGLSEIPESPATFSPLGLWHMLLSCLAFAIGGACVYEATHMEPNLSPLVTSFVRVLINLLFVAASGLREGNFRGLWGDARWSLWLRGGFGSLALMLSFASIAAVGVGEAAFLQSSNAIFIGLLAPLVLGRKNPKGVWFGLLFGLIGVGLLCHPRPGFAMESGRVLGLLSGLSAAFAYLMLSKAGRTNPPRTVIFYFSLMGLAMHVAVVSVHPLWWPPLSPVWLPMIGGGVAATFGQHFLTRAYQEAPAVQNAATSYIGPVMSMILGALFFRTYPDAYSLVGAGIIIVSGIVAPLRQLTAQRKETCPG